MMRRRGGQEQVRWGSDEIPTRSPVPFIIPVVIAVVAFVLITVALSTPLLSARGREIFSDVALVPVAAAVPLTCLRTARRTIGQVRAAWLLMGLAGLLWTLGEAGWFLTHYVTLVERSPSFADAFYLLALLPAAGALVLFPPPSVGGRGRIVALLGCLVAAGSVLFVTRSVMNAVWVAGSDQSALADAFYTAYPIVDVALVGLSLVALIRSGTATRPSLRLVAAGVATFAVADTIYSIESSLDAYAAGSPTDLGWFAGYLLMALAALHPSAWAPRTATPGIPHGSASSLLVYVPIVLATLSAASLPPDGPDPVLIITGFGLIVAFGVRQGMLAADHSQLNALREEQLAAVRESETRLRRQVLQTQRITQSVADGILVLDADRRIVMTNGAVTSMLHQTSGGLLGERIDDLLIDPAADRSATVLAAVTDGTVLDAVDTPFRTADSTVTVEVTVGPIQELGRTVGTVLVLRDVSARRALDKLKNEFVSVVSHELRTPLTSIRGSLALLDGGVCGALEPAGSRMVTRALQASERLSRLIDDLLDIERLESGALTMEFETCDAARLVEAAEREMRGLAQQHDVELVRLQTTGRVRADPDRIVQTLSNLISNAVKFSPPGSRISLSATPVPGRADEMFAAALGQEGDEDEGLVEFSVRDQGRGIPSAQLESVFERFRQVDSSDARQRGGTGLGLAICRNIVQLHGGRIWVTSEIGTGSDFRFVLPAVTHATWRTPPEAVPPDVVTDAADESAVVSVTDEDPVSAR